MSLTSEIEKYQGLINKGKEIQQEIFDQKGKLEQFYTEKINDLKSTVESLKADFEAEINNLEKEMQDKIDFVFKYELETLGIDPKAPISIMAVMQLIQKCLELEKS